MSGEQINRRSGGGTIKMGINKLLNRNSVKQVSFPVGLLLIHLLVKLYFWICDKMFYSTQNSNKIDNHLSSGAELLLTKMLLYFLVSVHIHV